MRVSIIVVFVISCVSYVFLSSKESKSVNAANTFNDSVAVTPWYVNVVRDEGISSSALFHSYEGFLRLKKENKLINDSIISLIDFSRPSYEERFFIIDVKNGKLVRKSLVAHGKNSGMIYAESFSNRPYSNKSSLGLYITSETYIGKHGYSLRINGMDNTLNSNARKRAVVIHAANYVSQEYIENNGRIGRSFGCPALPTAIATDVINLIKGGSCLYIYHPQIDSTLQLQQEIIH